MVSGDVIRHEISRVRESAQHREGPHGGIKVYLAARRVARQGDRATQAEGRATYRGRDLAARRAASHK